MRFVAGADDADDRAEAFVAEQLHLRRDAVDDMGGHQDAIRLAAVQLDRACRQRIIDERTDMGNGLAVDHRAQRRLAFARVAHRHGADLCLKLLYKGVGDGVDHDDPFGRHADLALVHESAEGGGLHCLLKVGVLQHDQRRLAAQLQHHRFQMFSAAFRDDPADRRRSGEVHAAHGWMVDHCADHIGRILWRVGDQVDDAASEACFHKGLNDQAMGARALFRCLEHQAVATGERHGDGAGGEDDRRVPRRHRQHHACRFPDRHGDAAGLVGRDHLSADLGSEGGRFAHHRAG